MHQLLSPLYPPRVKEEGWTIFNPMGWMGHRETCPLVAGIHLSLYYDSITPLCLTSSRIHYEIYLLVLSSQTLAHLTPRSFCQDCRRGFGGPPPPSGYVGTLPMCAFSFHIGTDSQSLQRKEHRQMLCVPKPHNLESWPPLFGHITVPRRWKGQDCGGPNF